jgi:hypothetical protein
MHGKDASVWVGKTVTIHLDDGVSFGGGIVGRIRIRFTKAKAGACAPLGTGAGDGVLVVRRREHQGSTPCGELVSCAWEHLPAKEITVLVDQVLPERPPYRESSGSARESDARRLCGCAKATSSARRGGHGSAV